MSQQTQISRRQMLRLTGLGLAGVALAACGAAPATSQSRAVPARLRFGVGPLQPTPEESKTAFEPFFRYLAEQLGAQYDLVATTDWAGISVALANDQIDLAWMGPWGYVLANHTAQAQAIATVKYDNKPIYHAIIVGRPGLNIQQWPDDAKGLSISFADVGSTSGWLIPTTWFQARGIDPKSYFQYSEGATHAANEIAVANGQVDLATDFDRNRNAMIESGKLDADATEVVWTSDPLPNDAIAIRTGFDPALAQRIQQTLVGISAEQARMIMPNHYTGFVAATHADYKLIEDAGIAVGRIAQK
jgi:phosphonate transport system substrate-binding protein